MKVHTFRLKTGQDLKTEIEDFAQAQEIQAGFIATCVGSLSEVGLRMAGASPEKQDIRRYQGHFEIISLVGTVAVNGCHLHLSFSDENGQVTGGHLKEGSVVNTTAEIIIGEDENSIYTREIDPATGFPELVIQSQIR